MNNIYSLEKKKQVFRGATVGASGIQKIICGTGERVLAPLNAFVTFCTKSKREESHWPGFHLTQTEFAQFSHSTSSWLGWNDGKWSVVFCKYGVK